MVGVTLLVVAGRRRTPWPLLLAAAIAVAALLVLYAVWRSPHRTDLSTYGAFAVALVALAAGWIGWAWRRRQKQDGGTLGPRELDELADQLAEAVRKQWEDAASERGLLWPEPIPVHWRAPSEAMASPVAAAVGSTRFQPLPGLRAVRAQDLLKGDIHDLQGIYGGLGSARLVIAGAPGSGKTGAAVLLILAALRHRKQATDGERPQVPVPVMLTLDEWDPSTQKVQNWLAGRLRQTYPLFVGRGGAAKAAALLAAGKVAVILDGLDEIAGELRPVALQALSQQANFRLVLLSRTAEMASAATERGVLQGAAAIELRPIDPATAADYLERVQLDPPPDGWRDLIGRLRSDPGGPLSTALDNPLTLTLVRDTYRQSDDARELLDLCNTAQQEASGKAVDKITEHLLDRVLPAAYTPRPGEPAPRYDLPTAQRALAEIAAQMNQDGTRDLQWWCFPRWAPAAPRVILGWLVFGLVGWLVFGLVFGPVGGLVGGLVGVLAAGLMGGAGDAPPRRIRKPRIRWVLSRGNIVFGLVGGLVGGLVFGLVFGLVAGLVAGLLLGLVGWVSFGLGVAFIPLLESALADPENTGSPSPVISWRHDRNYALVYGLVFGLMFGLAGGFQFGLVAVLVFGLAVGFSSSRVGPSSLTAAQLALRWHTPVRLVRFLDDARERNVLRTIGPVYQFRHARLQDRLAEQLSAPALDSMALS